MNNISTKTTISALGVDNPFRINNVEDYALIEVTARSGPHEVVMSFPWAHSIPYMDISVQNAITKCKETAINSLTMHLEGVEKRRREAEAKMNWVNKLVNRIVAFARREIGFFFEKAKIGVDTD